MTYFDNIRLTLYLISTVVLAVISRRAIHNIRSHGFFRFIAWEAIAALVFLNLPYWLSNPFSMKQLASWTLLVTSLFVLWQGLTHLRAAARSRDRTESELYDFERTSELITSGIYRYLRHPLYASLLYLAWGAFLKDVSWISIVLVLVASTSLLATAKADETECVQYFGDQYKNYIERTTRFIPFVL